VNIGNPEEWTVLRMAETIVRLTGSAASIVHEALPIDDPRVRQPNIAVARERLGWSPTVSIEDGIRATVEDFRRRVERIAAGDAGSAKARRA